MVIMALWPTLLRAFASSRPQRSFVSTARFAEEQKKIPMTLLSGFLGSGKTSTLKHLLENTDGVKIGVIVNDVASVNIDAKLISGTTQDGMIELQNGCACCSLADELLTAVDSLLKRKGGELDALVVELSGVADPVAIKANWKVAKQKDHPATKLTDVSKVVTLVDACTFGSDWMTYDIAGVRQGWTEEGDDCSGQRQVTELLAEQVEAADLILINKIDMASKEEVTIASTVARGLNVNAELQSVEFGKISPKMVIGNMMQIKDVPATHDHSHSHDCLEPDCTDPSHAEQSLASSRIEHAHDESVECEDPACSDTSHSHNHDHASKECADPVCTDTSHSHSHAHASEVCEDVECTDTSHDHSHSHRTSTDQLQITNFVYKRDRPFHAKRLLDILNQWPVPVKDNLDLTLMQEAQVEGYSVAGVVEKGNPFIGVLRSKGFIWLAPNKWMGANNDAYRHDTAMYWSHAGKHFGITSAGKWWGTIPKEKIKEYFPADDPEYSRILAEDFVSDEWGDRRQELVFIGINISEDEVSDALDKCLLRDHELQRYRQDAQNLNQMMLNAKSAGLFGEGGMDQYDPDWNN